MSLSDRRPDLDPAVADRLDALTPLFLPALRDSAGRHDLDGQVPDLGVDAVRRTLDGLGAGELRDGTGAGVEQTQRSGPGAHDDAHLRAFEALARVEYGEARMHRRSARPWLQALDVSGYARPYAPETERAAARRRHLAAWPATIETAVDTLDDVPAPLAAGLLRSVHGVATGVDPDEEHATEAIAAHARLVGHLERLATDGDPDAALGGELLARWLGAGEAMEVDLGALEATSDRERDRLTELLTEACRAIDPDRPTRAVVADLLDDHPDAAGVLTTARELTDEVLAWVDGAGLLPELGGTCEVAPSPPSRRWATAMMSWSATYEPDGPSFYYITPPDLTWDPQRQRSWLSAFSHSTLPSTTVHEVAPGHFSHGRALRRLDSDVRRHLHSASFVEGWAHYAEELLVEEGYRAHDPRFQAGVALKALLRVTRLAVAIGLHRRTMGYDEAVQRFRDDALLRDAPAEAEAARGTFDPTYGRYTWGKLEILRLRDQARARWGAGFTARRFHEAVLALGAPPLGLLPAALDAADDEASTTGP
ncbi:DUF885 family protein [Egicoccus halophilus]|uniref:DUF885 domain-containing protein n=1 Tax=Egicoccus halophilus TaxID=1670830 RepID=A0A8J3ACS4_9ACTN|nr:DUF885 family protein [Egicoccus halophilus]GGI04583.1 hypothetical protein GCM10011354_09820 [Egicoccus halophilus]